MKIPFLAKTLFLPGRLFSKKYFITPSFQKKNKVKEGGV